MNAARDESTMYQAELLSFELQELEVPLDCIERCLTTVRGQPSEELGKIMGCLELKTFQRCIDLVIQLGELQSKIKDDNQ